MLGGVETKSVSPVFVGRTAEPAVLDDAFDRAEALGLTSRERDVLRLVAAGHTNRRIAEALFISPETAGVHVSNILAKLGVSGRGEAAAVAHRLGLFPDGTPHPATARQSIQDTSGPAPAALGKGNDVQRLRGTVLPRAQTHP
ncbi:hypothetical protein SUDANB146_01925 [Streptomyces sp. enrichment culture]